jgi:Fe-S oxidoreductase
MAIRMVVGLLIIGLALAVAARRGQFLFKTVRSGQPSPETKHEKKQRVSAEATQVLGQKKLLQWSVPGVAHVLVFWGFIVLTLTIIETVGALFWRDFAIPVIGSWQIVGFLEDLFGLFVLIAIIVFAIIRLRNNPATQLRTSRFFGSHVGAAWFVLFMIFNVVWTMFFLRAAQVNTGHFPYNATVTENGTVTSSTSDWGAFVSNALAVIIKPLGLSANAWIETIALWLQLAAVFGFLVYVLYSKHMHIFTAPPNVFFGRQPNALGPLLPMYSKGQPINFEDPGEDDVFGKGVIADNTWKNNLDYLACTECGRCQSQCPAWNTEKPLSPKLLIMNLRDHMMVAAPYLSAQANPQYTAAGHKSPGTPVVPALDTFSEEIQREMARPLVGSRAEFDHPETDGYTADGHRAGAHEGPVINEDALWSCTMCGACVYQCPVDIEHIDQIVDMRRNQVLVESNFPTELGGLFKNIENKGNPWGMNASARTDWISEVDFDVRVFGAEGEDTIPDDVEYLFWVGCAGAYEDRAKRTTKAVAELLTTAGVNFMVLGDGETCTGDPARRAGNEFLFQMQAQQNVEVLNEIGVGGKKKPIVVSCPHCLNTLAREYPQLDGHYDVVHHTQLLDRLVREGKLTPVRALDANVTYHDPCYLGRHNGVYNAPRELVAAVPGASLVEMDKKGPTSFCCGAGGARMWMEEHLGTRVNMNRTEQALSTGATKIAVACPFCSVMLNDGVTVKQQDGAATDVEVIDVASLLLNSVKA